MVHEDEEKDQGTVRDTKRRGRKDTDQRRRKARVEPLGHSRLSLSQRGILDPEKKMVTDLKKKASQSQSQSQSLITNNKIKELYTCTLKIRVHKKHGEWAF